MKLLTAFFRLIRWQNLVFILLTQMLFYYCILRPALPDAYYQLSHKLTQGLFYLLVTASVFIAAGGYIINDYFDINIDQVNKPDKMVIEKVISRRWAIILHWVISTIGVGISCYVSYKTTYLIFFANILCTILLWFYSTTFKKKLLTGNIMIAALTAWTVLVIYFAANSTLQLGNHSNIAIGTTLKHLFKLAFIYGGFAFIISLVREVVKDMEDMEGDEKYHCRTLPIVWGVPVAKVFVGVWLMVLVGALGIIQIYVMQSGYWLRSLYCLFLVILPCLLVLKKIYHARQSHEFHKISTQIKLIMLAGILSMSFFLFNL